LGYQQASQLVNPKLKYHFISAAYNCFSAVKTFFAMTRDPYDMELPIIIFMFGANYEGSSKSNLQ
jgi:hypothetical protein